MAKKTVNHLNAMRKGAGLPIQAFAIRRVGNGSHVFASGLLLVEPVQMLDETPSPGQSRSGLLEDSPALGAIMERVGTDPVLPKRFHAIHKCD